METRIIVACDPKNVIGKNGQLPWRMPDDLQLFRMRTLGSTLIMGRKTWENLPKRPLDKRANVVISNSVWMEPINEDGPYFFSSISHAISAIRKLWKTLGKEQLHLRKYSDNDIFIIGGASIYKTALDCNLVDVIIMSRIHKMYDGDIYFPELSNEWKVTAQEHHNGFDTIRYRKEQTNGTT